jgi:hypothetical protein
VALGNDFTGFADEGKASSMSEMLPWIQQAIDKHYSELTAVFPAGASAVLWIGNIASE